MSPRRRLALFFVVACLAASVAQGQVALRPDEARTLGTQVPDVTLIGEDSTAFALSSLAGKPIIVSPIFTTCPQTCPLITASLRDALAGIGEPGVGYHVLSVSFDAADGPAQLRDYRRKMELPAGWTLAVASPENLARLLRAIDFNYEKLPDGGFVHANVIAILSPTLTVSSYLNGVSYEEKELRRALEIATRKSSLVYHYRPYMALVAVLALATAMTLLVATRKKRTQPA
jgi:protein SCO1/2